MNLIKKEYVKILEWGFKLAYLFLGLATFNSFIYDSPIQPMLVKICLVLGVLSIIGRILFFRDYMKTPYWWLLALFCISFCITILVNRQYAAGITDIKWLLWTGFVFFIVYVCDGKREPAEYKKEFTVFSNIIIVVSVIFAVVSLYLMFHLYHRLWNTADGEVLIAGFQWGRLWGVYTDPNYGGVFSTVAILLSAYFIKSKKGFLKIWYIAAAVVDYFYIIFSDSRTAEVSMCVGAGILILFFTVSHKNNRKGILIGVLLAVVFAGAFPAVTSTVKSYYNARIEIEMKKAEHDVQNAKPNTKPNTNTETEANANQQKAVGRKQDIEADVSNGRFALWESGFEIWKTKPVFGTGYNSFLSYVKEKLPDTYVVNNNQGNYVSLHNGYINVLVYQGIAGAIVFLAFMVCTVRKWCAGLKSIKKDDMDYIAVLTACCAVIAVSMVFLLEGIYTNSPGVFILWSFLGYLMQYFTANNTKTLMENKRNI